MKIIVRFHRRFVQKQFHDLELKINDIFDSSSLSLSISRIKENLKRFHALLYEGKEVPFYQDGKEFRRLIFIFYKDEDTNFEHPMFNIERADFDAFIMVFSSLWMREKA